MFRRLMLLLTPLLVALLFAACDVESAGERPGDAGRWHVADVEQEVGCEDVCDPACERLSECVVEAVPPALGDLLIEEFYYSGAVPAGGADRYYADQFIELVNVGEAPLDLSGVMIGDAEGAAGEINPGMRPDSFAFSRPDDVVLSSVWRFPEGTRMEPGGRLVVAHDGTNHRPFSTIDLSAAAFETYVEVSGRDDDYATVPNLESVAYNAGADWLVPVFGASIVVLEASAELEVVQGTFGDLRAAPVAAVLDAVEALMDADAGAFKRFPASLDAGFAYVSGTYTGESLHRVQANGVWQDTDDSSADFFVGAPDPYRAPDPPGVVGDVAIELGTGYQAFEPLQNGDDVDLIAGLQGGWHVNASVRLSGVGPDGVLLVYDAVDSEGARISFETQALLSQGSLLAEGEGWLRLGDLVVMEIDDAMEVLGSSVTLRVTASFDGQTWSDERTVRVVDPLE